MGKKKKTPEPEYDEDIRIYPDPILGRVHGASETQAVTDPTDKFAVTGVVKPSDTDVEEGRNWVNENKK